MGAWFTGVTVQLLVPDFAGGVDFYSRLIGRPPDFEPHEDFVEWEVLPGFWLQLGEGTPRRAYPLRLAVDDVAAERARAERELGAHAVSAIQRIPGLVAFCNFDDPWGNRLGFYERLFTEEPAVPGGSFRDEEWGGGALDTR
jgi:catechol 2,3-dioxygenase-like lactoylglutathione lyase family enzyme